MAGIDLSDIIAPLNVTFKQLVASIIALGKKGVVLYATKNASLSGDYLAETFNSGLNLSISNATVKKNVQKMFDKGAKKVILFSFKTDLDSVSTNLDSYVFNWIVTDSVTADQTTVSAYAKAKNVFGLAFGIAGDSINVVNCPNPSVIDSDGNTVTMPNYLPVLAGALAGLPYTMSATGLSFPDLKRVNMPTEMHAGEFILYNESDEVKVAAAINSLTTTTTDLTDDMKEICVAEGMKRFKADIMTAFRTGYKGKYKNSYDNQCLFIAASKGFISELERVCILDPDYNNTVDIDVDAQRLAWIAAGKAEADIMAMSDAEIKKLAYKKTMFLKFNVKFLEAIEGAEIVVNMY